MQTSKKTIVKKMLAFLLAFTMVFSIAPFSVMASSADDFGFGFESEFDPVLFPGGPVLGHPIFIPRAPQDGTLTRNIVIEVTGDTFIEPDRNAAGAHIRGTGSENLDLWSMRDISVWADGSIPANRTAAGPAVGVPGLILEEAVWTQGRIHLRIRGTGTHGNRFYIMPHEDAMLSGMRPEPLIVYFRDVQLPPEPGFDGGDLNLRVYVPGFGWFDELPFGTLPPSRLEVMVTAPDGLHFRWTYGAAADATTLSSWRVAQWFGDLYGYVWNPAANSGAGGYVWGVRHNSNDAITYSSRGAHSIGLMLDTVVMWNDANRAVRTPDPTPTTYRTSPHVALSFVGEFVSGGDFRELVEDLYQMLVRALSPAFYRPPGTTDVFFTGNHYLRGLYGRLPIAVPEIPMTIEMLQAPTSAGGGMFPGYRRYRLTMGNDADGMLVRPGTHRITRPISPQHGLQAGYRLRRDTPQLQDGEYPANAERVYTFRVELDPISGAAFTQAANDPALWRLSARDGFHPNNEARGIEILNVRAEPESRIAYITVRADDIVVNRMTGSSVHGDVPFNIYFRASMLTPVYNLPYYNTDFDDPDDYIEFDFDRQFLRDFINFETYVGAMPVWGEDGSDPIAPTYTYNSIWLENYDPLHVDFFWLPTQLPADTVRDNALALTSATVLTNINELPFFDATAGVPVTNVYAFARISGSHDRLVFVWNGHYIDVELGGNYTHLGFGATTNQGPARYIAIPINLVAPTLPADMHENIVGTPHAWTHIRSGSTLHVFAIQDGYTAGGLISGGVNVIAGDGSLVIPRAYTGSSPDRDAERLSAIIVPSTLAPDRPAGWYSDAVIVNIAQSPLGEPEMETYMHVGLLALPHSVPVQNGTRFSNRFFPANNLPGVPSVLNPIRADQLITFNEFRREPFSHDGYSWTGFHSFDEGEMIERRHFLDLVIVGRGYFAPAAIVQDLSNWTLAYGFPFADYEGASSIEPYNVVRGYYGHPSVTRNASDLDPALGLVVAEGTHRAEPGLVISSVTRISGDRVRILIDQISGQEPVAFNDILANGLWISGSDLIFHAVTARNSDIEDYRDDVTYWGNPRWANAGFTSASVLVPGDYDADPVVPTTGTRLFPRELNGVGNSTSLSRNILFTHAARVEVDPITPPAIAGFPGQNPQVVRPVIPHESMGGGIHRISFELDNLAFMMGQDDFNTVRGFDITNPENWETTVFVNCTITPRVNAPITHRATPENEINLVAPASPRGTTFQWQSRPAGGTWADIATGELHTLAPLTVGTHEIRLIMDNTAWDEPRTTAPATVLVAPRQVAGVWSPNWQCDHCMPSPFARDRGLDGNALADDMEPWWTPATESVAGLRLLNVEIVDSRHVILEFTGAADSLSNEDLRFFIRVTSDERVNIGDGNRGRALNIAHRQTTVEPVVPETRHGGWIYIGFTPDETSAVTGDYLRVTDLFVDAMPVPLNPFDPLWPRIFDDAGNHLGWPIEVMRTGAPQSTSPRERRVEVELAEGLVFYGPRAFTQNLPARVTLYREDRPQARPLYWSIHDANFAPFYADTARFTFNPEIYTYYRPDDAARRAALSNTARALRLSSGAAALGPNHSRLGRWNPLDGSLFAYGMELIYVARAYDSNGLPIPNRATLVITGDAELHANAMMMVWVAYDAIVLPTDAERAAEIRNAGGVYALVRVGNDLRPELVTPTVYIPSGENMSVDVTVRVNNDDFTRYAIGPYTPAMNAAALTALFESRWTAAIMDSVTGLLVESPIGGYEGTTRLDMPFAPARMGEQPDMTNYLERVTITAMRLQQGEYHHVDGSNHFTYIVFTLSGNFTQGNYLVLRPIVEYVYDVRPGNYRILPLAGGAMDRPHNPANPWGLTTNPAINETGPDSLRLPVTYLVIPIGVPGERGVLDLRVAPAGTPAAPVVVGVGQTHQFSHTMRVIPGTPTGVAWRVEPSTAGTISPTGLLTVHANTPAGIIRVIVNSIFDTDVEAVSYVRVETDVRLILNSVIADARALIDAVDHFIPVDGSTAGFTMQETWAFFATRDALQAAIDASVAIHGNPIFDAPVVSAQIATLRAAMAAFEAGTHRGTLDPGLAGALYGLERLIEQVQAVLAQDRLIAEDAADVDQGVRFWYQSDVDTLAEELAEAEHVIAIFDDNVSELNAARIALTTALNTFNATDRRGTRGEVVTPEDAVDNAATRISAEFADATVAQAEVNTAAAALAYVQAFIAGFNLAGVTTDVVAGDFTAAVAGDEANPAGTDGSFTFTVTVTSTEDADVYYEAGPYTLTITATFYGGFTGPVERPEGGLGWQEDGEFVYLRFVSRVDIDRPDLFTWVDADGILVSASQIIGLDAAEQAALQAYFTPYPPGDIFFWVNDWFMQTNMWLSADPAGPYSWLGQRRFGPTGAMMTVYWYNWGWVPPGQTGVDDSLTVYPFGSDEYMAMVAAGYRPLWSLLDAQGILQTDWQFQEGAGADGLGSWHHFNPEGIMSIAECTILDGNLVWLASDSGAALPAEYSECPGCEICESFAGALFAALVVDVEDADEDVVDEADVDEDVVDEDVVDEVVVDEAVVDEDEVDEVVVDEDEVDEVVVDEAEADEAVVVRSRR